MDALTFLLLTLCAVGIHRLWIYEDVFKPLRTSCERLPMPWRKMLTCPPCFAFWSVALAFGGGYHLLQIDGYWRGGHALVYSVAAYPLLRGLVWLYAHSDVFAFGSRADLFETDALEEEYVPQTPTIKTDQRVQAAAERAALKLRPTEPQTKAPCPACEEAKRVKERLRRSLHDANRPTLVLLTTLSGPASSYSVATVVRNQASAAVQNGWRVLLVVQDSYTDADRHCGLEGRIEVHPVMPSFEWREDEVLGAHVVQVKTRLQAFFDQQIGTRPALVLSHDLIFQSWFLTHAQALHQLAPMLSENIRWFHIAHSMPPAEPFTDHRRFRSSVPQGHKVVALTASAIPKLQHYYGVAQEDVVRLPNCIDLLRFYNIDAESARALISQTRLTDADIVQVYPLSILRWGAKGVGTVCAIFGRLKDMGYRVRLVLADAHNTGTPGITATDELKRAVAAAGLHWGEDVVLLSDYFTDEERRRGEADWTTVSSLMRLANLFVFPSLSEAAPLVLLEASAAGNLLVLNRDLPGMPEVIPHQHAIYLPFGAADKPPGTVSLQAACQRIIETIQSDRCLSARQRVRQHFSLSALCGELQTLMRTTFPDMRTPLAQRVNAARIEQVEND